MALVGYIAVATMALSECPAVHIENKTSFAWNETDKEMVVSAKKTCKEAYGNLCLVRFIKLDENTYQAVCGG